MDTYQIAVIVGSLRKESFNARFAEALLRLAPEDFTFERVRIDDLPLYNQDDEFTPAETVIRLRKDILSADGLLFFTPEYNRSIPGALKNAIDQASRPYGQSAWTGKPAGVIGVSMGVIGTALAQQHLRNILAYLDVPTLGQPEAYIHFKEGLIDSNGDIGEASRQFLQEWMERYAAWVRLHAKSK